MSDEAPTKAAILAATAIKALRDDASLVAIALCIDAAFAEERAEFAAKLMEQMSNVPMIRYECVWCKPPRVIREEPAPDGVERTSHEICKPCRDMLLNLECDGQEQA